MRINEILDHLFFVNYELKFDEVDRYFEKMRFRNTAREESILSFVDNHSGDANGISYYTMNIADRKILNSSFSTTKEINLEAIKDYAQKKYGLSYEQEVDNIIIYKRNNLQLHIGASHFPESEFSKIMYKISLFEPLNTGVGEVLIMPPPAIL